jgi:Cys-tRNA synthase (O-phospho-L-seryl-tRNA:Cys-tRNA synthase)
MQPCCLVVEKVVRWDVEVQACRVVIDEVV